MSLGLGGFKMPKKHRVNLSNLFFLIFITTIIIIRFGIYAFPNIDLKLGGLIIHHFWFGIILIVVSILIKHKNVRLIIFAIGSGLAIDQFVFIVLGGGDLTYWNALSTMSTIILIMIVFLWREKITSKVIG